MERCDSRHAASNAIKSKYGKRIPGRGRFVGEGKILGFTIRITLTNEGEQTYSVLRSGRVQYDSPLTHNTCAVSVGSVWDRRDIQADEGFTEANLSRLLKNAKRDSGNSRLITLLRRVKNASRWLYPGTDLTGDGRPNLVVVRKSIGSHGHQYVDILDLGTRPRRIATITVTHRDDVPDALFIDLNQDGFPEIRVRDWTYEAPGPYHDYCYPGPRVVLKYHKGRFAVATDLMQRKAPSLNDLRLRAGRLRASKRISKDWVPEDLWQEMLNLIYTGHAQLARRFFDLAWPKGVRGKHQFLAALRKKLHESPYWPAVRRMDGGI